MKVKVAWWVMGLVLAGALVGSSQLIVWPEMLVWPYLAVNGFEYYRNIITIYPPLLLNLLAWIAGFSWGWQVLGWVSWGVCLASVGMVGWWAERMTGSKRWMLVAMIVLAGWQARFEGLGLWFDQVIGIWLMVGFWGIWKQKDRLTAVALAAALLTKQTAVYGLVPAGLMMRTGRSRVWVGAWVAILLVVGIVGLVDYGEWGGWWQQTVVFPVSWVSGHVDQAKMINWKQAVMVAIVWGSVVGSGLLYEVVKRNSGTREKKVKPDNLGWWLVVWGGFVGLGSWPRFELFHLQPSLGFGALALVWWGSKLTGYIKRPGWLGRGIGLWAAGVLGANGLMTVEYLADYGGKEPRFVETEMMIRAEEIRQEVGEGSFYSYNGWDHWYQLSSKLPVVDWIYPSTSLYYDFPGIQEKTVEELKKTPPQFVLRGTSENPELIDDWVEDNYEVIKEWEGELRLYLRKA